MKNPISAILRRSTAIGCGVIALSLIASPVTAQAPGFAMLAKLMKGEWTLNYRDGRPSTKVCVRSGLELLQLRHPRSNCSRFVVDDTPAKLALQYKCSSKGYGRTNIRRETNSLVQIDSHGMVSGRPYEFAAEARRTGTC